MRRHRKAIVSNYISYGDHNFCSDVSGMVYKSSDMAYGEGIEKGLLMSKKEWSDGNLAQLYLKSVPDHSQVDNVRTVPPYSFPPTPEPDDF